MSLGALLHPVQEIDSVEYGLTDIQEYYANTGALKRAAEAAKGAFTCPRASTLPRPAMSYPP